MVMRAAIEMPPGRFLPGMGSRERETAFVMEMSAGRADTAGVNSRRTGENNAVKTTRERELSTHTAGAVVADPLGRESRVFLLAYFCERAHGNPTVRASAYIVRP